jgi:hypothetical protein
MEVSMNRRLIPTIVAVAALVAGVGCATKMGPGESPVTSDHGEATAPGSVKGAVHSMDGRPVVAVMVVATSLDEPPRAVPEVAVVTDGDGRFEWPLKPGRYRLKATTPAGSATRDVTVGAGDTDEVHLVVAP